MGRKVHLLSVLRGNTRSDEEVGKKNYILSIHTTHHLLFILPKCFK